MPAGHHPRQAATRPGPHDGGAWHPHAAGCHRPVRQLAVPLPGTARVTMGITARQQPTARRRGR